MSNTQEVSGAGRARLGSGMISLIVGSARSAGKSPTTLGGLVFVGAGMAVNLTNFAFHAAVSRLLGPAGYGALGALLNVLVVLSVPFAALEAAVTRMVASRAAGAETGCRRLSLQACLGGLIGFVVWLGLTPLVEGFLRLHSALPVVLLGLAIPPMTVGAVWQGALIGEQRFKPAALSQLLGSGVVRLAAGVVLVTAGAGVSGAVVATVAASLTTLAVLYPGMRPMLVGRSRGPLTARDAAWTVACLGGVSTLTSLDSWLGRHYLAPSAAGYFTAAATAGRIALFLPGTVILVAFPRFSRSAGRSREAHRALAGAVVWVTSFASVGAGVLVAIPGVVTGMLFGGSFEPSVPILRILAPADACAGVISVLVYFQLARRSKLSVAGWAGCCLIWALASIYHRDDQQLAWTMLAANATTLAFLGVATLNSTTPGHGT